MQALSEIHNDVGSCKILFGPMFSGKTTELCKELTTFADLEFRVLYINHKSDERKTEKSIEGITTHHSSFENLTPKIKRTKIKRLEEVDASNFDVIGIDEGQFFDDLDVIVRKWVLYEKKIVIIASLDGDWMMKPFGKAVNLICICEPGAVIKLAAKCSRCIQNSKGGTIRLVDAGFTGLLENKHVIDSSWQDDQTNYVEVGGSNQYLSLCMACHLQHHSRSHLRS